MFCNNVRTLIFFIFGSIANCNMDRFDFSIWKTDTRRSYEGLLMVSISGGARGTVCRYIGGTNYNLPDLQTAGFICRGLGFHKCTAVSSIPDSYTFRNFYSSKLYGLRCTDSILCRPTYTISSSCSSSSYYSYISCGCDGDDYPTPDGCQPCPEDYKPSGDRCLCNSGAYWTGSYCVPCPAYSYTAPDGLSCTDCPTGAYSDPGSDSEGDCTCHAGMFLHEERKCVQCPENTFSTRNSTTCEPCTEDAVSTDDRARCVCSDNLHWDSLTNHCTKDNPDKDDDKDDDDKDDGEESDESEMNIVTLLLIVIAALLAMMLVVFLVTLAALSCARTKRGAGKEPHIYKQELKMGILPKYPAPEVPAEESDRDIYENDTAMA